MKKVLTGLVFASTLLLAGCNEEKKEYRIDSYNISGENFVSLDEIFAIGNEEEMLEFYRNLKILENSIRERLKEYLSHSSLRKAIDGEVMALIHGKTPSQIAEMARDIEEIKKVTDAGDSK